jgi:hypothetical protein
LWQDDFGSKPPFSTDIDVLFVAYQISAELGCFLALGWPLPRCSLDLWVEHRHEINHIDGKSLGHSLLAALADHDLAGITKEEKRDMRALVLRGGPWSESERQDILEYCQSDVDCLVPLLERMLPAIRTRPHGLPHAIIRGRYMAAFACMERAGIPIDVDTLESIRQHRHDLQLAVIHNVEHRYPVFADGSFRDGLFAAYLVDNDMEWPRTVTGLCKTNKNAFKAMVSRYPEVEDLHQVLATLRQLRKESLAIGPDGRNRGWMNPFGCLTSRHAPKASEYVFNQPAWMRALIKPPEGRALAYLDWCSQEICIAAVLSADAALLKLVEDGDPYIATAVAARLVPEGATKKTHPHARELCKTTLLGMAYGMQPPTLSMRTGLSLLEARDLLMWMRQTFPDLAQWSDDSADTGQLTGALATRLGWTLQTAGFNSLTLRNFPVQANGAEILRQAICLAVDRGIMVDAQVHDALLVEAGADEIHDVAAATQAVMAKASAILLDGMEIATDAEIVTWPNRYLPEKGQPMWEFVTRYLEQISTKST